MDDVAQWAGLSRSAVYCSFANMVLGALHERTFAAMAETTRPRTEVSDPPPTAMREAIALVVGNWRGHTAARRTFHETANASAEFGDPWRARLPRHVVVLADLIERERAARRHPGPPLVTGDRRASATDLTPT